MKEQIRNVLDKLKASEKPYDDACTILHRISPAAHFTDEYKTAVELLEASAYPFNDAINHLEKILTDLTE